MFKTTLVATALATALVALAGGFSAQAGETPPTSSADDGFRLQSTYFAPDAAPVSKGVRGLIRSLDRARDTRTVSSYQVNRHYSLDAAIRERSWRARVSEELATLFK